MRCATCKKPIFFDPVAGYLHKGSRARDYGHDAFPPDAEPALPPATLGSTDECYGVVGRLRHERNQLADAAREALAEIEYWHAEMLTDDERAHPRGSGWARVHDKLKAALGA